MDIEFLAELPSLDATAAELSAILGPPDRAKIAAGKVRIVKDVLRTGRIFPKIDKPVDLTLSHLQEIAEEYKRFRQNKNASPFAWGKPIQTPGGQHNIEARDTICDIEDIVLSGERLFIVGYTDPHTAGTLKDKKVSVSVKGTFFDGQGNQYKSLMDHVAVVVHPVVSDQLETMQLSALAISPEIRQIVNQLLAMLDLPQIGNEISDEEFQVAVQAEIDTLQKVTGMKPEELQAALTSALAPLNDAIGKLDTRLAAAEKAGIERVVAERRATFVAALEASFKAEKIDATEKERLLKVGEKCEFEDFALSLIPAPEDGEKKKSVQSPSKNEDGDKKKSPKGMNPATGQEYELSCYTAEEMAKAYKGVRISDLTASLPTV